MNFRHAAFSLAITLMLGPARADTPPGAPGVPAAGGVRSALHPPAVPLVVHDPYLSIWSTGDRLTDRETVHWTGVPQPTHVLVRVDGRVWRLVGTEPAGAPAAAQTSLEITPTRTICGFRAGAAAVTLTFLTPALPADLDLMSRPLTTLTIDINSIDKARHTVALFVDVAPVLAVHTPEQHVDWARLPVPGLQAARIGTVAQPVLARQGDDTRIDWGHALLAVPDHPGHVVALAGGVAARDAFARDGAAPVSDAPPCPGTPASGAPSLVAWIDIGSVGGEGAGAHLFLGYDDLFSIRYFDDLLRPYWRRGDLGAAGLLAEAERDLGRTRTRCERFDAELMGDMRRVGGPGYAALCALAYRQALGGAKLAADALGKPLFFPKENHSNGCIATVDIIYPMGPLPLLLSPALTRALLVPVFDYAASPRWKFPFAPHDLGRYPHATGQVYGGGERTEERQMMVEESANLILLAAALARAEGDAGFAATHWPLLERWAGYLAEKGFDPEEQLCTDDFAGHLAHNVNLSAKAILALGAFAQLATARGDASLGRRFDRQARDLAARWVREAADGDHTRLAFDRPGTWSQKYNLVWDRLLGLDLFPAAIRRGELDFYRRNQNLYGLPLDSRSTYTKLDWIVWSASLTGDPADLRALLDPLLLFVDRTLDRCPLTDWYFTDTARRRGFTARPVVGGVFIAALGDAVLWRKWAARGEAIPGPWAPIPISATRTLCPMGAATPAPWRVTATRPPAGWLRPGFDASSWRQAPGPFGVDPDARTRWDTPEIWLRREFELGTAPGAGLRLRVLHAGDTEIHINGVPALRRPGDIRVPIDFPLCPEALATLVRPGGNVLAVHSRAAQKGARRRSIIDVGLVEVLPGRGAGGRSPASDAAPHP